MSDSLFEDGPTVGRYQARVQRPPWTDRERCLAVRVLLSCPDVGSYNRTCVMLCKILGREPAYPDGAKPAKDRVTQDCRDVIESERWKWLAGYKGWVPAGFPTLRDGRPLTWAEKAEFIESYYRLQSGTRPRLSLEWLERLLWRKHDSKIADYTKKISLYGLKLCRTFVGCGIDPTTIAGPAVVALANRILKTENDKELSGLWRTLDKLLGER